ncbi:hypothetical protein ACWCP6_34545 [Streptomyces sp. NPDC002004]
MPIRARVADPAGPEPAGGGRRSGRTTPGSRAGLRVTAAVLLTVGLVCLVFGGRDFAYATRLAGTPGTFEVLAGESVPGNGRSGPSTVWSGIFTSSDGRTTDHDAALRDEADGHRLGARIPVTRAGAHTYYTAQPNYALGWLCLCLAGASLAVWAVPGIRFGRGMRRADPGTPRWVRVTILIGLGCAYAAGAAGAAGLAVAVVA